MTSAECSSTHDEIFLKAAEGKKSRDCLSLGFPLVWVPFRVCGL